MAPGDLICASKKGFSAHCQWLQATYLICASKKGFSAHWLHRVLGVTYKTAWFTHHRIREAMRSGDLAPFGANGGAVEVDETFIGHDRTIKPKHSKKGRGYAHKHKVLALVDRDTGRARPTTRPEVSRNTKRSRRGTYHSVVRTI